MLYDDVSQPLEIIKFEPTDPAWTENGYKFAEKFNRAVYVVLTQAEDNLYAAALNGFNQMVLKGFGGSPTNHITNVFDKDAPAVPLDLSGKIDFYYVPLLSRSTSGSQRDTDPDIKLFLNDLYTTFPRDVILNEANPYFEMPPVNIGYGNSAGVTPEPHTTFKRAVDFSKTLPGARAFDVTDGFLSADPISADDFPGDFINEAVTASGNVSLDPILGVTDILGQPIAGSILLAIIVRNDSQVFYVW